MKRKATKKRPKCRALIPYKRTSNRVRQEAFIAEYVVQYGNKAEAARRLGIPYSTVMKWLKDEKFMERLQMAEEQLFDELQASAFNRAGTSSDVLAIFMLKKMKPELYDDKVRQMKYAKEQGVQDQDRTTVVVELVRGEEPERLKTPGEPES